MFLPKTNKKGVKNVKNQKKAIAFFSARGHISKMANHKILIFGLN